ncbi:MAG: OmpP1/FadL family transporter [Gemmatimonadota bacterium]
METGSPLPRRAPGVTRALAVAALLLLALPVAGRSQAFLRSDLSARAMAMGGASAATVRDAGAVYHHAAGIVHLAGTQVLATGFTSSDETRLRLFGDREFDEEDGPRFDGAFYVTHQIAQQVTAGIAVTEPWYLDVDWERPTTFAGRFRASEARLRSLDVKPVVAIGPFDRWSLALGVDALHADLDLERFEQDPALSALGGGGPISLAHTTIGSDATGVGWNASVAFRPDPRVTLGAQFDSEIEVVFNGFADFDVVAPTALREVVLPDSESTVGSMLDARFVDQSVRIPIVFPRRAAAGMSVRAFEPLELTVDAAWTDWDAVDSLAVLFADTLLSGSTPWPQRGAWSVRVGTELEARSGMLIRLGYAWQETRRTEPTATPVAPAAGSDSFAAGVGFLWSGLTLDLAYRLTLFEDTEGVAFPANSTVADGVYEGLEHRLAIGISRSL